VTNILTYGSLLHMDANTFSGAQRPGNLADYTPPARFVYSLFSQTGGEMARADALLKWPWQIHAAEWQVAGFPDARTGGFGPLFALGLVASLGLFSWAVIRKRVADWKSPMLAAVCLISSALFPEGWWLRYVPFAYLAPFLLVLAVPDWRIARALILLIFTANALIAVQATHHYYREAYARHQATLDAVSRLPQGAVYLVPPGDDYLIYNHAHRTIIRRFAERGVVTDVRVDAGCPKEIAYIAEFRVCTDHTEAHP
jgi:hypothetical protein